MKEVTGKYNTAKVFTDTVDENSLNQILLLCNQEFTEGAKIRLMPDVHAGAGCTIGTTMTIRDKIVPNLVGVDIGCGMETLVLKADSEISQNFNPAQLDKCVHKCIPSGFETQWPKTLSSLPLPTLCRRFHTRMLWPAVQTC